MHLFVVVGMPAAGKNIARLYAESKGIPYFASGDAVRAEVKRRGLTPDAENMAAVSTAMRGEDGLGVTARSWRTPWPRAGRPSSWRACAPGRRSS
jgi:dephospho-CoA kinase